MRRLLWSVYRSGQLVAHTRHAADAASIVGRYGPEAGGIVKYMGRAVWEEENELVSARVNPVRAAQTMQERARQRPGESRGHPQNDR